MSSSIRWHVHRVPYAMRSIQLYGIEERAGRQFLLKGEIVAENVPAGVLVERPTLDFTEEEAQQILDELWKAGLRPNNGESSLAHVEAMRAHLADMRQLTFSLLEIDAGGKT